MAYRGCGVCGVCGISNRSISNSSSGHRSSSPPQLQQQQQDQEEEEHEEEQEEKQQEENEGEYKPWEEPPWKTQRVDIKPPWQARPDDWICPICGNHNLTRRCYCNGKHGGACRAPRDSGLQPGDWYCDGAIVRTAISPGLIMSSCHR